MSDRPLTSLNEYRLLGHSGLKVSPLCLGTMTFGEAWGWGANDVTSRRLFDLYADRGGNFIDTANNYTNGSSERLVGSCLEGRRDRFVVATKYTLNIDPGNPNAGGNHRKSLVYSVERSLRNLGTDYIDLLWVHVWDGVTPVEEMMRALDDVVRAGKVCYVAVSDFPAWKIAEANTLARVRGLTPFVALQIHYNLILRDGERDLIPMAIDQGIAVLPWSPLAGGVLSGKYTRDDLKPAEEAAGSRKPLLQSIGQLTESSLRVADEVVRIGRQVGRSPAQVALNWMLQKPGIVSPIVGARTPEQLEDNLGCLEFTLGVDRMAALDEVSAVDLGFPHDFISSEMVQALIDGTGSV